MGGWVPKLVRDPVAKIRWRTAEMALMLWTLVALTEDTGLMSSIHFGWLRTAYNTSSRGIWCRWPLRAPALTCTYSHKHVHTLTFKGNKGKILHLQLLSIKWSSSEVLRLLEFYIRAPPGWLSFLFFYHYTVNPLFCLSPCELPHVHSPLDLPLSFLSKHVTHIYSCRASYHKRLNVCKCINRYT